MDLLLIIWITLRNVHSKFLSFGGNLFLLFAGIPIIIYAKNYIKG